MAISGTVSQPLSGSPLTFTDTSTDLPPITERILYVLDPAENILDTIDMGDELTAEYAITEDQWIRFKLSLNGGAYELPVDYLSENFYYNGLVASLKAGCACGGSTLCSDAAKAMLSDKAAVFYTTYGYAENADTCIKAADELILT